MPSTNDNARPRSFLATVLLASQVFSIALAQQSPSLLSSPYAPKPAECPAGPIARGATGLSPEEQSYISQRKQKADAKLKTWLSSISPELKYDTAPLVALTTSGGGYRSMLLGGGMVKAMDERESKSPLAGLYQALSYHAGLSGGSWLLGSIAGNGFDTISTLSTNLWAPNLVHNIIFGTDPSPEVIAAVQNDISAKAAAGYPPTTPEVWGRYLGYQLLSGPDGGVAKTMSGIAKDPAFVAHDVPLPIITALGVQGINGSVCDAPDNATTYEFSPFEFGSWDEGVKAFAPTELLGSQVYRNGSAKDCVTGFDNLGIVYGASSAKFNENCGNTLIKYIGNGLNPLIKKTHELTRRDLFVPFPNPFRYRRTSPLVRSQKELYLVDGGQALQNNPIWPLLQPSRAVDVLIVNDNSADTDDNWPNGTEIQRTYTRSIEASLTRMPFIPAPEIFVAKNLNKNATFFGCYEPNKVTIVYLPNFGWGGYDSNKASAQFDYERNETQAMINVGTGIATQGGDKQWSTCLGCAIIHKNSSSLPDVCKGCLDRYCYD